MLGPLHYSDAHWKCPARQQFIIHAARYISVHEGLPREYIMLSRQQPLHHAEHLVQLTLPMVCRWRSCGRPGLRTAS